jgi:hypothetical protein
LSSLVVSVALVSAAVCCVWPGSFQAGGGVWFTLGLGDEVPSNLATGASPLGVHTGAVFVGEAVGVVARAVAAEAGDSGRRNGDDRGDPIDSGDGLYIDGFDCRVC